MSNDEIMLEIETITAQCVNDGERFAWFVWDRALTWDTSNPVPYLNPGFICRIHLDKVRRGMTWRIREKIAWRLDTLRQRRILE